MPPQFNPNLDQWTIAQLAAQMVIVRTTGFLFDHQLQYPAWEVDRPKLQSLVESYGVGGVIFLGGSAAELAIKIQQLQAWANVPLLLCADIEEGVGQRFSGGTWFAPPMALNAIAQQDLDRAVTLSQSMGNAIAQEAKAIGLNWVLAPIVDVNNNPNNPVINIRAFGEDPSTVCALTSGFMAGVQSAGLLTCAKHFPGHGDTDTDSHLDLPRIEHDRARLDQVEFPPFQSAIQQGVDAVMTAHLDVPAIDNETITTFSKTVMTGLLREEWGFEGLIVTDALMMGAIVDRYGNAEVAVRAIEGGADLLMMPLDAIGAIESITQAVTEGRLTRNRLEASVRRILATKAQLPTAPVPTFAHLTQSIAQPAFTETARSILRESLFIRPGTSQFTDGPATGSNLVLVEDLVGCGFLPRTAPAIVLPQRQGFRTHVIAGNLPPEAFTNLPSPLLLQIFVRGNPLKSTADYVATIEEWFEKLGPQLEAIALYGSPYLLQTWLKTLPESLPIVFSYGQMPEAQTIALESLFELRSNIRINPPQRDGLFI